MAIPEMAPVGKEEEEEEGQFVGSPPVSVCVCVCVCVCSYVICTDKLNSLRSLTSSS